MFPRQLHAPASDLATVRGLRAILAATPRFVNGAELRAAGLHQAPAASSTAASQKIERQGRRSGTGRTETDRFAINGRCAQRLQWGRVRGRSRPAADIAPRKNRASNRVRSTRGIYYRNYLIRPPQQRWRDRQLERLGGLEVDDQLELARRPTGSSAGLAPFRILSLSSGRSRHSSDHIRRKENASRASRPNVSGADCENERRSAECIVQRPNDDHASARQVSRGLAFAHGHGYVPIHGHRGQHHVVGATTCCDAGRARAA